MTDTPKKPMGRPKGVKNGEGKPKYVKKPRPFKMPKLIAAAQTHVVAQSINHYDPQMAVSKSTIGIVKKQIKIICHDRFVDFCENQLPRLPSFIDGMVAKEEYKQAFDAVMSVTEFVMPKLARTEHTGADGKDLVPPPDFGNLTPEQRDELRGLIQSAMTPIDGGVLIPHDQ